MKYDSQDSLRKPRERNKNENLYHLCTWEEARIMLALNAIKIV